MQWIFPAVVSSNHHNALFIVFITLPVSLAVFLPLFIDEYRQYRKEYSIVQKLSKRFRHHRFIYKYRFGRIGGEIYVKGENGQLLAIVPVYMSSDVETEAKIIKRYIAEAEKFKKIELKAAVQYDKTTHQYEARIDEIDAFGCGDTVEETVNMFLDNVEELCSDYFQNLEKYLRYENTRRQYPYFLKIKSCANRDELMRVLGADKFEEVDGE